MPGYVHVSRAKYVDENDARLYRATWMERDARLFHVMINFLIELETFRFDAISLKIESYLYSINITHVHF